LDLSRVEFVLVRPARAGNVAAACRAMKNMGIVRLRLVDPPAALAEHEARALAYGAWDVLDGAARAGTLDEAVAASALVVGTSARSADAAAWSARALAEEADAATRGGTLSVVFGPESSGLTRDELARCHRLVRVPTDPGHPSLNLAQAVLIVAYELRLASLAPTPAPERTATAESAAPTGEQEAALRELEQALLAVGYLDPQRPGRVLAELRRLLARASPTRREIALLRGVARQVAWAGRVAKGPARTP
jgi:TrmH family RNA methyltransferase